MSRHLCPFALWTALPSSLVGRCSHDYYGHSVTPRLAPQGVDPTFVPVVRIERDVGVPLISLIALTGQRSTPQRLRWPHYQAVAERGAGIGCLSGGRAFASSGDWDLGNPAFAISRGSRDTPALTPGPATALLACDCSVHLSDPGKPSDPRTFLRVPSRLRRGYNRAPRGALVPGRLDEQAAGELRPGLRDRSVMVMLAGLRA